MRPKRILTALTLALSGCVFAIAQDNTHSLIITESGETIKAYNVEVGPSTVFYTEEPDANSETKKIKLSEVMIIKNEKGEKWVPGSSKAPAIAAGNEAAPTAAALKDYSDSGANKAAHSASDPAQVSYTGKVEDKSAGEALLLYKPTTESVLADKNIEYRLVSRLVGSKAQPNKDAYAHFFPMDVDLYITNRSNAMIYVDLGNTFFMCNGESMRYYVPSATTSTSGSTTGGSVNLGAVAGAMGMGGSLGRLASGINIGGSNSNIKSEVVFSERVLAIPPGATEVIKGASFSNYENTKVTGLPVGANGICNSITLLLPKDQMYTVGETVTDFDKQYFHKLGAIVTYGLTEDLAAPVQLRAAYNPDRMIAAKHKKMIEPLINVTPFSDNYKDHLGLFIRLAKK